MRAVLQLLLRGVDDLATERQHQISGVAKEAAALAGLRLLRTALQLDKDVVELFRARNQNGKALPFE